MAVFANLVIGLVFGLGLLVSGMSNPTKVLGFLDVASIASGTWDPSLALVMLGAITVALPGYRLVLKMPRPQFAARFHLPTSSEVDSRLFVGAALFGIGWGLVGLCPGPALTSLAVGGRQTLLYVLAMVAGMTAARWLGLVAAAPAARRPAT
jgi:uncharacterized membrane protein YedE/YeeE